MNYVKLKQMRWERRLSQERVCKDLQISVRSLRDMENGSVPISKVFKFAFEKYFEGFAVKDYGDAMCNVTIKQKWQLRASLC